MLTTIQAMISFVQDMDILKALRNDERGVTAVEYAIIAGVLGGILVTAFTTFGGSITTALTNVKFTG